VKVAGKMQQWITVSLVFLILGVVVVCGGHYSEADGRFYFPEFQDRAVRAHDQQRPRMVSRALSEAAGVYKDKSRSAQLGLQQSVFITVVSYTGQARYKALLHNFLCFTEHYGIDLVVYVVQHNIKDWKEEQVSYARAGIRMLSYPDELFWTLMYTKSSMGQGEYTPGSLDVCTQRHTVYTAHPLPQVKRTTSPPRRPSPRMARW
jgi:hypothetical protein